ncbi:MAG: TetR/AcrR family transcriptional regulator [bacterium]|nr:TetR/AcrR family transcriptional regulator [bacterium]
MGRPVKFNETAILDAALEEGQHLGFERLSASRVAKRLGAPSGSLYHRYRSRDTLVGALWLRTVERFQGGYLEVLCGEGTASSRARAAAQYALDWVRAHPAEAQLLLRYRREDLLKDGTPGSLSRRASVLNQQVSKAFRALAHEISPEAPDMERVRFACIAIPLAAARDALFERHSPPDSANALVDEAVAALFKPDRGK